MDAAEPFLEKPQYFLFSPTGFFLLLFLGRALVFSTMEAVWPARPVPYRAVIASDLVACVAYVFVIFPIAAHLSRMVASYHLFPARISELPLVLRVVLYFLLADFGHYWIHRVMHTRLFWQVHKWHHSPTYMYWLGGVRATLPQQFLVNIPYVLAYPLVDISPWWMLLTIGVISTVQNDWVHMNVSWRMKWLEYIFVTPRFHHIHHSVDPRHYMANMGNIFSIWDRLFGTYADPDTILDDLSFGINTKDNPMRLVLGL
jgi:sterol desaturase/sphingolipid hydroxylase (fatty acid hydroxylase superfamily)